MKTHSHCGNRFTKKIQVQAITSAVSINDKDDPI